MHSKTFLAIIMMIVALVFVTACERGDKDGKSWGHSDHQRNFITATSGPAGGKGRYL
jgi:hypothetical protein